MAELLSPASRDFIAGGLGRCELWTSWHNIHIFRIFTADRCHAIARVMLLALAVM